jgi:hypothetical protein
MSLKKSLKKKKYNQNEFIWLAIRFINEVVSQFFVL